MRKRTVKRHSKKHMSLRKKTQKGGFFGKQKFTAVKAYHSFGIIIDDVSKPIDDNTKAKIKDLIEESIIQKYYLNLIKRLLSIITNYYGFLLNNHGAKERKTKLANLISLATFIFQQLLSIVFNNQTDEMYSSIIQSEIEGIQKNNLIKLYNDCILTTSQPIATSFTEFVNAEEGNNRQTSSRNSYSSSSRV